MLEPVFYIGWINIFSCHQILDNCLCNKTFQYAGICKGILDICIHPFVDAVDCVPIQQVILAQQFAHVLECENSL